MLKEDSDFSEVFYKLSSGLHWEDTAVEHSQWPHVLPVWDPEILVSAPRRALRSVGQRPADAHAASGRCTGWVWKGRN